MSENSEKSAGWPIFKVLASPGKAFEEIAANPAFLKTALVICGLSLLLGIAVSPKIQEFTLLMINKNPTSIPPEQAAIAAKAAMAASIVFAAVIPWLVWLMVAVLFKVYAMFAGGNATFKTYFSVAVYGYLPQFIGGLIGTVLLLAAPVENFQNVSLSLAALLPAQSGFLYFFLSQCSPFTWWSLVLYGIGGAAATKTRPSGAITYIVVLWLLYALAAAALASIKAPAGMVG
ncbi:MAG: Yip1 family protein [Bacillota bacterium]